METVKLAGNIKGQLKKLEATFWEVFVESGYLGGYVNLSEYEKIRLEDKETWLFYGTRELFYKICVYIESKNLVNYLDSFKKRFQDRIDNKDELLKGVGPIYDESDPSMLILDEFAEFLSPFEDFSSNKANTFELDKLRLILENTKAIVKKHNLKIRNESDIYKLIKWHIEMIFPSTKSINKARFISKFKTYHPDILVPEIETAIEYKYIKTGENPQIYLEQLKIDADNYINDPQYKNFIAVIYFENIGSEFIKSFNHAIKENRFPSSWEIIAAI